MQDYSYKHVVEFGDFQTPKDLAHKACALLARHGFHPKTIIEPTCGVGNLLVAALEQFPSFTKAVGLDISATHIAAARSLIEGRQEKDRIDLRVGDFFRTDWAALLGDLPEPFLLVGNPPWATNAQLGRLKSSNLPEKSNFLKHRGLAAMTGKSNFDISEWMLMRVLHWLDNRHALMGMFVKTAVARKLLAYAWRNQISIANAALHRVNAPRYFGTSVDACFFICRFAPAAQSATCRVFHSLDDRNFVETLGDGDGAVVSVELFARWKHLRGDCHRWRSGLKHNCSKVMELTKEGDKWRNGFGETVEIEETFIFPLLKSADLAHGEVAIPRRWVLVTQRTLRDDTSLIQAVAPKTWNYLLAHAEFLDQRRSKVYRHRPRFSVFGVGAYSFSPWKVAISGFAKKLAFAVVGTYRGKPMVLDDTSYFIPCEDQVEAEHLSRLLNSRLAREFFECYIFWEAKRPVTIEILRRLDLAALETELNKGDSDHNGQQKNACQSTAQCAAFRRETPFQPS